MKPDDSKISLDELRAVEERAKRLLDRADAWKRFPVPVEDILAAANVKVAEHNAFDPVSLIAYLKGKAESAAFHIKSAMSKVWGLYDASDNVIHIDDTVVKSRQTFLKLHETGHHDLPWHKKLFRFFQDCEKTLAPEISDQFEKEANNFARFVLFKGDTYGKVAADHKFEIKTPITLASKFGASVYASAREFARTNERACVVYVLEPAEFVYGHGFRAQIRRIEPSPKFREEFGEPSGGTITPDHALGPIVPIGRKMTRPTTLSISDKNGVSHECIAEAFDTTYNILILLYPIKALTKATIILPSVA